MIKYCCFLVFYSRTSTSQYEDRANNANTNKRAGDDKITNNNNNNTNNNNKTNNKTNKNTNNNKTNNKTNNAANNKTDNKNNKITSIKYY